MFFVKNKYKSQFAVKIVKGTFLLTLGSVASRGLLALAYIVLARILTVTEYGEYGMIKSTIDSFLVFASMGIGLTTTKYISEKKNVNKLEASSILGTALMLVFVSGLIVFMTLLVFSDYIALNMLNNMGLKNAFVLGAGVLVFIALNGTQLGALIAFQSHKNIAIVNISQGILIGVGLCVGALCGGVQGAILGNLLAVMVLCLVTNIILKIEAQKEGVFISMKKWKKSLKMIYRFAIPASLSSFITAPAMWLLNILFVNTPNGYSELGIYSAVVVVALTIQMLNGSLSNVLLPIFLSKEVESTPQKEFFNYFIAWFASILLAIPFFICPEVITFILGTKYSGENVKIILYLSIMATLLNSFKQGVSRDLIMKNKMWLSVFSMGQWAITSFVLFYILRGHGAVGYALALCLSWSVNVLIFIPFFVYKKISPRFLLNKWVFVIFILLISMLLGGYLLGDLYIYRTILVGILAFFILISFKKLKTSVIARETRIT